MSSEIYELHAEICKVFSNPKRLEILDALRNGEKSVNELVDIIEINQANISQHLAVMRQSKIVISRREGINIYYRLANPKIIKASDTIKEILMERLKENQKLVKIMR
jgi:ArsR family transcriptional regulator